MRALIRRNPASSIAAFFAALPILTLYIADLQEASEPLGVPPVVWASTSAVIAVGIILGQVWQRIRGVGGPVSWKSPTIVGYLLGFAGVLTPFVADLADATAPLGAPAAFWFVVGQGFVFATSLHRVWQAVQTAPVEPGDRLAGVVEPA